MTAGTISALSWITAMRRAMAPYWRALTNGASNAGRIGASAKTAQSQTVCTGSSGGGIHPVLANMEGNSMASAKNGKRSIGSAGRPAEDDAGRLSDADALGVYYKALEIFMDRFGPVGLRSTTTGRIAVVLPAAISACPRCRRLVLASDTDGAGECGTCAGTGK